MENYHEYQGRNQRNIRQKKPKINYPKKLIRQIVISLLILGLIFSPGIKSGKENSKLREMVKFALNYNFDIKKVSDILSSVLEKSIPTYFQGDSNEDTKSIDEKAF